MKQVQVGSKRNRPTPQELCFLARAIWMWNHGWIKKIVVSRHLKEQSVVLENGLDEIVWNAELDRDWQATFLLGESFGLVFVNI